MKHLFLAVALGAVGMAASPARAAILADPFTSAKFPGRAAHEGAWQFKGGVAGCVQDNDVFKKNGRHGPSLSYAFSYTDGTLHLAVRPEKVEKFSVAFGNSLGYDCRVTFKPAKFAVEVWNVPGKTKKPENLVPKDAVPPGLMYSRWTEITLQIEGDKLTVSVGPKYRQTFEHPDFARVKEATVLSFSYGSVQIKDFRIEVPNAPAPAKK